MTSDILSFALRPACGCFKIAPGDFVESLDFLARLAALVPRPRAQLGGELIDTYVKLKNREWSSFTHHLSQWERSHTLEC